MRIAFLAAALLAAPLALAAPLPSAAQQAADPALAAAVAHARRDADRVRDQYRHPAETLAFFQVQPGMTVVDYVPADGWYTRIIAPYLGPNGRYVAMGPDMSAEPDERQRNYWGGQDEKMRTNAPKWNLGPVAPLSGFSADVVPDALSGAVDRVFIFRELHNMLRSGWLHDDMLAIRKVLKPGGMVGIEQHRAPADWPLADGSKGYLREKDVIALFDLYGFDLVAQSEINANPKDTKDWPQGVWMLPPGLRGATDETRARMQAIGESDRMTMLFRKRG